MEDRTIGTLRCFFENQRTMSDTLPKLKLQLIQAILRTDDPEVLRTALQVLSLDDKGATTASANRSMPLDNLPEMLNQGASPTDPEIQDLQRDIDEVFKT